MTVSQIKCTLNDNDDEPNQTYSTNDGEPMQTYVGVTETTFKTRYNNHKASFTSAAKRNATELSKNIWDLKNKNVRFDIKWKVLKVAPYSCKADLYKVSVELRRPANVLK